MMDPFIDEFIRIRKQRNMSLEDVSQIMGISADAIRSYESGFSIPSLDFISKAKEIMGISTSADTLENTFVQGSFGRKIPLLTEYELINDCSERVMYYFELPHLEKYGESNMFALRYTGDDVPDKGILNNAILVFTRCEKVDRDGVYAIVKRDKLSIKTATFSDGKIRLELLDGKKRTPNFYKTVNARGRMVSCINTYK